MLKLDNGIAIGIECEANEKLLCEEEAKLGFTTWNLCIVQERLIETRDNIVALVRAIESACSIAADRLYVHSTICIENGIAVVRVSVKARHKEDSIAFSGWARSIYARAKIDIFTMEPPVECGGTFSVLNFVA